MLFSEENARYTFLFEMRIYTYRKELIYQAPAVAAAGKRGVT